MNNQSSVIYTNSKFTTNNMLRSNLCDFGDAGIFVKEAITSSAGNAIFGNCTIVIIRVIEIDTWNFRA